MTETINVTEALTEAERKKMEEYGEALIATRPVFQSSTCHDVINVDAVYGMCAGLGGEKSTKQMIKEAWDEIAAKYDYK